MPPIIENLETRQLMDAAVDQLPTEPIGPALVQAQVGGEVLTGDGGGAQAQPQALALAGVTRYVSPKGLAGNAGTVSSPWPSVQYALSMVGGGNTIILEPGTYGGIVIGSAYSGTSSYPTVIKSQYRWKAVIVSNSYGVLADADWVVIDGLKVSSAAISGIKADADHVTVRNDWVTRSHVQGMDIRGAYNVISYNLVEYNGTDPQSHHGIYFNGDHDTVSENVVRNNASEGIVGWYTVTNASIKHNLVYGNPDINVVLGTMRTQADSSLITNPMYGGNTLTGNILLDSRLAIYTYGKTIGTSSSGNIINNSANTAVLDRVVSAGIADYVRVAPGLFVLPPLPAGDTQGPAATLLGGSHTITVSPGAMSCYLFVDFTDKSGINLSSLDNTDLLIRNSSGSTATVKLRSLIVADTLTSFWGVYMLVAPGGTWGTSNTGPYTVYLKASQTTDGLGKANTQQYLGTVTTTMKASTVGALFTEPWSVRGVCPSTGFSRVQSNNETPDSSKILFVDGGICALGRSGENLGIPIDLNQVRIGVAALNDIRESQPGRFLWVYWEYSLAVSWINLPNWTDWRTTWQKMNDNLVPLAQASDGLVMGAYIPTNIWTFDQWKTFVQRNADEIRRFAPGKPLGIFLCPIYYLTGAVGEDLSTCPRIDIKMWQQMLAYSRSAFDTVMIWWPITLSLDDKHWLAVVQAADNANLPILAGIGS